MELFFQTLPFLLVGGTLAYFARKETQETESEWKEEEDRKARVRALSPQPSYEERMGVRYGPTGSHDV